METLDNKVEHSWKEWFPILGVIKARKVMDAEEKTLRNGIYRVANSIYHGIVVGTVLLLSYDLIPK